MVSKLRVEQLETLDGQHTKNVSDLVVDISTETITTSTGGQSIPDALDDRVLFADDEASLPVSGVSEGQQAVVKNGGEYVFSIGSWVKQTVPTAIGEVSLVDAFRAPTEASGNNLRSQRRAAIQHKRTDSYGGLRYDVTRTYGGPDVLVKKYGPDVNGAGEMLRRDAREAAKTLGYPAAFNADFFSAPDGSSYTTDVNGVARGLQIVDGIAYRDWQSGSSVQFAYIMNRDGSLVQTTKTADESASKTAQDWVDEGALWSVAGPSFLVVNGQAQDVEAITAIGTTVSARTILGQDEDGNWIIISVEGKSNDYGIGGNDMPQLALDEGCYNAILLDGGGSSQAYWGDAWAMPSSDTSEARKVTGWLLLDLPSVPTYESGFFEIPDNASVIDGPISPSFPAIYGRQVGSVFHLSFNCEVSGLAKDTVFILTDENIPIRYLDENSSARKGVVAGLKADGGSVKIISDVAGALSAVPIGASTNQIAGTLQWNTQWASEYL